MLVRFETHSGKKIGINPDNVITVVETDKDGIVHVWPTDDSSQPMQIKGEFDEVVKKLNSTERDKLITRRLIEAEMDS